MSCDKKKKNKSQKYYNQFNRIANSILSPDNIVYDLIELVPYGNGFFGIKIFIDNAGTYIIECDKEDYVSFLKDTKKEVLKNPYKCPFCGKKEPSSVCNDCGSIFIESFSLSGRDNDLTNYSGFVKFADNISEHTGIPEEVIGIYCAFDGDIKEIINGVDVIYKGASKFPVFCLSKSISKKDLSVVDKNSLKKLILSYIASSNNNYYAIEHQVGFGFNDKELMVGFDNSTHNVSGIIYFESNYFGHGILTQDIRIGISFSITEYIKNYFKENNLDLSKLDCLFDDYYDYFCENIMDLDCFDEMIGHDNYITYRPENGFEFDITKMTNGFDVEELENQLNYQLNKYVDKIFKSSLENL